MCDGVAPRAHDGDRDEFAGVTMDSYGVLNGKQPHFRTIIPRQYGGEAGDSTEHLSIPNRLAEIRSETTLQDATLAFSCTDPSCATVCRTSACAHSMATFVEKNRQPKKINVSFFFVAVKKTT